MEALKIQHYATQQLNDNAVVKRVVAGEKELFEILMRRYNQMLYRVVRGYLKDEDDVQDVMQTAYLKAFSKLHQFLGNASFSTWLIRIGINEALQRLHELKKKNVVYLNPTDIGDDTIRQVPDKEMNPEKVMMRQEMKQVLEQAIDSLPDKYRVIYILKEVEGLSNEEVAESLGLSDSNIKVRLHRAKTLLKDSLLKLSVTREVFEFGNSRCDAIVSFVMKKI